ncbi:helix-turn-helix domain-containing protein [Lactobacillus amylovorus]|uniref:helix-turn-helix domain-containing protein n=1 Tax=Lactobacillus amylovorus TaxID=1604 RepID=UPI0023305F7F|nr:helix-turn-helix transcriptional regulator [Lactobacillus amylovorus]MDB6263574.1 helix-turn-helix domain-containing protein [Lactobacillus amylovorus]
MLWQRIDHKLKKRKWTLRKLSNETGINYETIRSYKYQHKEPSFKNACKISEALNIDLNDLKED